MSQSSNVTIYDAVKGRYGAIAEGQSKSCCSSDSDCTCTADALYTADTLVGLPQDVTGMALGCGDPVSIAGIRQGETVLDLGSGGGIDCFLAARQAGPTGQVIGVDMTPAMLEKANANKASLGLSNVDFRLGQIESLPVDDASVDLILSNCVINLSPDKPAVFAEAFRVLKPGGRMSISDKVTEGTFTDDQRADLSRWSACVSGAIDVQDYIAMMQAAGFENIAVVDTADVPDVLPEQGQHDGMPRLYSARITANKPA